MKEKVFKILEVDLDTANKLLETRNCILLDTYKQAEEIDDNVYEDRLIYSIGQVEKAECILCKDKCGKTIVYEAKRTGVFAKCDNCESTIQF